MTTERYTIVFVDKNDADDGVFIHDSANLTRYEIDVGQTPKDYVFTPEGTAANGKAFNFNMTFDPPDAPQIRDFLETGSKTTFSVHKDAPPFRYEITVAVTVDGEPRGSTTRGRKPVIRLAGRLPVIWIVAGLIGLGAIAAIAYYLHLHNAMPVNPLP
ncbi:MAG: hypothetical protein WBV61_08005 [Rhodanobacteraceae bacterium]